ncbi:hypothetical protein D3C72_254650 [compost metagenome]
MKKSLSLLAAGLLLVAGCAAGPQVATTDSGAMLVLTPEVVSGGYQAQDMPAVEPYTEANINRLVVKLYTVTDGVETAVTEHGFPVIREIPRANFSNPVIFNRLKPHTTYRAKTEAYGYEYLYTALIADEEKLLSTNDANSFTDIVVTDDDRPTIGKLKVRLKARPFSGRTDFGVDISKGGLVPGASESLTLSNPPS